MTDDELIAEWGKLSGELGLEKDHFVQLFTTKDDWTLVIKCSALVETALNHAFGILFPEPVSNSLEGLSLDRRRDLAVELQLLNKSKADAIRELARLRN